MVSVVSVMQHLENACVKLLGPVCYNGQGFTYELFHKQPFVMGEEAGVTVFWNAFVLLLVLKHIMDFNF